MSKIQVFQTITTFEAVGDCGVMIRTNANGKLTYTNLNMGTEAGLAYAQKLARAIERASAHTITVTL